MNSETLSWKEKKEGGGRLGCRDDPEGNGTCYQSDMLSTILKTHMAEREN